MKIHITRSYADLGSELNKRQNEVFKIAAGLECREMGIPDCTDLNYSEGQLSKLLDGVIASLEFKDLVFVELPTGNGSSFEQMLFYKILVYSGQKPVALWLDKEYFDENKNTFEAKLDKSFCLPETEDRLATEKLLLDCIAEKEADCDAPLSLREDEYIHIGFGLSDKTGNYYVWTLATIESVIEHTDSSVFFHIICDDTVKENQKKDFEKIVERGCHKLEFKVVDASEFKAIEKMAGHFSVATYFRSLIPALFKNLSKIIYLDSDIYVNLDIAKLWETDISDYCLAAVKDPEAHLSYPLKKGQIKDDGYFNSGVLCMNLKKIREFGNMQKLMTDYCISNPKSTFPDQDALNVVYHGQTLFIDDKYNYFVLSYRNRKGAPEEKIYHFAGTNNILYENDPLEYRYNELLTRLTEDNRFAVLNEEKTSGYLRNRKDYLMSFIKSMQTGKEIVFFGNNSFAMQTIIRKIYGDDESFFRFETLTEEVIPRIKDKIVIVLPEAEGGLSMRHLDEAGFVNGETYFVIPRLLNYHEGGYVF